MESIKNNVFEKLENQKCIFSEIFSYSNIKMEIKFHKFQKKYIFDFLIFQKHYFLLAKLIFKHKNENKIFQISEKVRYFQNF